MFMPLLNLSTTNLKDTLRGSLLDTDGVNAHHYSLLHTMNICQKKEKKSFFCHHTVLCGKIVLVAHLTLLTDRIKVTPAESPRRTFTKLSDWFCQLS